MRNVNSKEGSYYQSGSLHLLPPENRSTNRLQQPGCQIKTSLKPQYSSYFKGENVISVYRLETAHMETWAPEINPSQGLPP